MKSKLILPLLTAALLSCGGNNAKTETETPAEEAQEVKALSVDGKWRLTDYAGESEKMDMDSTQNYYLTFNMADSTFTMLTDCNSIGGQFKIAGDSLTFSNLLCTMKACPDVAVEKAMNTILPMITTYNISADSVLTLRADARKMANFKYVAEDTEKTEKTE